MEPKDVLLDISDTAFWVAQYRAEESKREDSLFKDQLAAKLLKGKGKAIRDFMDTENEISWPLVIRTFLFDKVIMESIDKVDTVLCLAAGLDTRPYRLDLPQDIKWVEVDFEGILQYKTQILIDEIPKCNLERISVDLTSNNDRLDLLRKIDKFSKSTLIITEGLLVYLDTEDVSNLSHQLASFSTFKRWILDIASPGLIKMMMKKSGDKLEAANAPFKFGPKEGPCFFKEQGWQVENVHSILKTAAKFKRVNNLMRFLAIFPESKGKQGSKRWSGVCELSKA